MGGQNHRLAYKFNPSRWRHRCANFIFPITCLGYQIDY